MNQKTSYLLVGIAAVSLIVWFVLPIYSFVFVVPLYNILGVSMAININQLMLIPIALGVLMIIGVLMKSRALMIGASVAQIIIAILTMIFKKEIVLEGNLKFIFDSATMLLNALKDQIQQWTGTNSITSENLHQIIDFITNYMWVGLGLILHMILNVTYLLVVCLSPKKNDEKIDNVTTVTQPIPSVYTPSDENNGYKHKT